MQAMEERLKSFSRLDAMFNADWATQLINDVRLSFSLDLEARVSLSRTGSYIAISHGLGLSIDDAVLNALCVRGFYTARLASDQRPPAFGVLSIGAARPERYHDYTFVEAGAGREATITRAMPLEPVRLAQAELLSYFALRWVVLHEQAHWLLGHLHLLASAHAVEGLDFGEARLFAEGEEEDVVDAFAMELQADALATQSLVVELLSLETNSAPPLAAYRQTLDLDPEQEVRFAPQPETRSMRFRTALLAAGICAVLFDLRRQKIDAVSDSHPPPAARIVNIALSAIATYGDIAQFEQGGEAAYTQEYRTDLIRPAGNDLMTSLVDLEIVARFLDLESPIYQSRFLFANDAGPSSEDGASPLAQDIFDLLLKGRRAHKGLVTDAGRIFAGHLDRSKHLYQKLQPFARVSGFV